MNYTTLKLLDWCEIPMIADQAAIFEDNRQNIYAKYIKTPSGSVFYKMNNFTCFIASFDYIHDRRYFIKLHGNGRNSGQFSSEVFLPRIKIIKNVRVIKELGEGSYGVFIQENGESLSYPNEFDSPPDVVFKAGI